MDVICGGGVDVDAGLDGCTVKFELEAEGVGVVWSI